MSYHSRRILTPVESRKRKEREALTFHPATSPKPLVSPTAVNRPVSAATTSSKQAEPQPQPQPLSSNRLLAGCMAHEFLTKGTLFGQKFDPDRAEAVPVSGSADPKRRQGQSQAQPSGEAEPKPKPQGYAEVANVLKGKGAHIPGVVNPTQLARWIQM